MVLSRHESQAHGKNAVPQIERKTVDHVCAKHGTVQAEVFRLYGDFCPSVCPTCKAEAEAERQRIQEENAHRAEAARKKADLEKRIQQSGIPARFMPKRFEDYLPATPEAAAILKRCRDYAEQFPALLSSGTSMILCGVAGTGKTHLACAIAHHIIHQHAMRAVYMHVAAALRAVKDTYAKGSTRTEQEAITSFAKPDLLILDEIGVQFGTDAERCILFEIINARYEALKPTVLISNLAMDGLTQYAGERVIDRMKENGGVLLPFKWQSHRGAGN